MRIFLNPGLLGAILCAAGCGREPSPSSPQPGDKGGAPPPPEAVLEVHYAGAGVLESTPDAAKLRAIAALAGVRKHWNSVVHKAATNAPRVLAWESQGKPDGARLESVLHDLTRHGFHLRWTRLPGKPAAWTLVAATPSERAELWKKNLSAWLAAGNPGSITPTADGWEVKGDDGGWRFVQKDGFSVLMRGAATAGSLEGALALAKPDVFATVAESQGTGWFVLTANGPMTGILATQSQDIIDHWLGKRGQDTAAAAWPGLRLTLGVREDYVRTRIDLNHPSPIHARITPWQVPIRTISDSADDPLLCLTAVQGGAAEVFRVLPWLSAAGHAPDVGLKPPDQLYSWGMSRIPMQMYLAALIPDATNAVTRAAKTVESRWEPKVKERSLGGFSFDPATARLAWTNGMPIIVPFLQPAPEPGGDFVVGGIFPLPTHKGPPPQELLGQFTARTNLLYYDWQITQGRLVQWKLLSQFMAMTRLVSPAAPTGMLAPFTAESAWLEELGAQLGNSVTEVSVTSPRQVVLTRKSHLGLTAAELSLLAHWMSQPEFPLLGDPGAKAAPQALPAPPKK